MLPPCSSSSFRLADSGGTDLSPHSSYGIRLKALFPYSTMVFCQPLSFFSQPSHSFAARPWILLTKVCRSVVTMFRRWQYSSVLRVEIGRRNKRIAPAAGGAFPRGSRSPRLALRGGELVGRIEWELEVNGAAAPVKTAVQLALETLALRHVGFA